jgi:tetratricopeptide (TPR) repeat protein
VGYSVVNFPFQIVPTALLWWTVLGISLGRLTREEPGIRLTGPTAATAGLVVIALAGAGVVTTASDLVGSGYLQAVHQTIEQKNHQAAKYWYELGMKMTPFDYRLPKWMGRIAAVDGDVATADRILAIRQKLHPLLADALDDRAQAYRQAGRRDEAMRYFEELVRIAPNYASAWSVYLGPIYFERKEYEKAADAFRQAVKYQEHDAQAWHNLAAALGTLKRYPEALAADQTAIRCDPAFVEGYIGAALSAKLLGQKAQALAIAQQGYAVSPTDPRFARLIQQIQR